MGGQTTSTPTAEQLVRRAQTGDRQAFGQLVPRYGLLVHGLCTGYAGAEHAPELAHEAFVEAWLKLPSLRDPSRFAPWLRTLTLNLCRMWHRRQRRHRALVDALDVDELTDEVSDEVSDGEDAGAAVDALLTGLSQLSDDHRLTLALHYWQGLTYEQIAAFLDVPMGTVMSRLHRARNRLRERMAEMTPTDPDVGPTGADTFRDAVDAEIGVLLRLWDEESSDPGGAKRPEHGLLRGRFFSEAGKRLSLLVASSPDAMRPVLATMDDALREHAALLLRRAGGRAIEVAVACAFDEEPDLRRTARGVLARVLQRDADQPLNDGYHTLPLRLTATYVLDAVLRSAQADADKGALLVDLLPGCEDDATLILMALALRAFDEDALPLLLQRWRAAGDGPEAAVYVAALVRFGTRFLAALGEALAASEAAALRRALAAIRAVANQIDSGALSDGTCPDPSLERRIGARLVREELDQAVVGQACRRLQSLASHDDETVRDQAIVALGELGDARHAEVVRAALASPLASTRHAGVVAVRHMGDRASVPELLRLARDDEDSVRRVALQALGHLGVGEARELLVELVDDPAVRPHAISALGEIGDDDSRGVLQGLTRSPDKKVARMAAGALYGGTRTQRPASEVRRQRLAKVRGADAQPMMHQSVVAAIRHLPEIRPYPEAELTRLIGEVCGDYSTTRRELVMGSPGLMVREGGIYTLSDLGLPVWRVERFLKDRQA